MAPLAALAGRFARIALVAPAIARMKRRAIRAAIGGALIALSGVVGLVFLLAALRTVLEREIGPVWAPAAIGGGLLVFAGIAYLVFFRPRASEADAVAGEAEAVRDKIAGSARALEGQIAQRPFKSLAVALAVGFAGASLLRLLRNRPRPATPRDGRDGRAPHPSSAEAQAWTRAAGSHEPDRRGANGAGA